MTGFESYKADHGDVMVPEDVKVEGNPTSLKLPSVPEPSRSMSTPPSRTGAIGAKGARYSRTQLRRATKGRPHFHRNQNEDLYLLEGHFEFRVDERRRRSSWR